MNTSTQFEIYKVSFETLNNLLRVIRLRCKSMLLSGFLKVYDAGTNFGLEYARQRTWLKLFKRDCLFVADVAPKIS